MVRERRRGVTDLLRQRILRGLQGGALEPGARLPSVRRIGAELDVDPRVVALAYRDLARDGLVEVRDRSGAFVAAVSSGGEAHDDPPAAWLAELVADGVLRGITAPNAARLLNSAVASRPVNVVVVVGILDQADGLARELRRDFGIAATGVMLETMGRGERRPRALTRAQFLLTTAANAIPVRQLGRKLGKPVVVAAVRADMLSVEWRSLMRGPVYVIVADARFELIVRAFVSEADGAPNVRVLVAGKDDLAAIPADAPTYVTESARIRLGRMRLPGRLIPPARILADESVRDVARLLVQLNLAAATGGRSPRRSKRAASHR